MLQKRMHQGPIDLGAAQSKFAAEVMERPGGEHLRHCFACGACTLSCPVAAVAEDYSPRLLIRKILLGLKEEVLSDPAIWYCHSCFRCSVHCPQDVRFTTVMQVLRQLAVEQGFAPGEFVEAAGAIDHAAEILRLKAIAALARTWEEGGMPATPEAIFAEILQGKEA